MVRWNDLVYSIEKTRNWQLFLRLGKHLYFRDKVGFWGWLKRPLKISHYEPFFEGSNMGASPYCRRGCIEHDKNLHGSKSIPKSAYKAFWYHGNKDA